MKHNRHFLKKIISQLTVLVITTNFSFAQKGCEEYIVGKTYPRICPKNISTQKDKLFISVNVVSQVKDSSGVCKIFYTYLSTPFSRRSEKESDAFRIFLEDLDSKNLYVNGNLFTGTLKLGSYADPGVAVPYSGYTLLIYTFEDGKSTDRKVLRDVDLETEKAYKRYKQPD